MSFTDSGISEDPFNTPTSYSYDSNGNIVKVHVGEKETLFSYDGLGRLSKVTDALGYTQSINYDSKGNILSLKKNDKTVLQNSYDALSRIIETTDELGLTTKNTYDKTGNLIKEEQNGERSVEYDYDKSGNVKSVTDAMGNSSYMTYDELGLVSEYKDALDNVTSYYYDKNGNQTRIEDALSNSQYISYDANGNITNVKDDGILSLSYSYNKNNALTSVEDGLGATTKYEYNELGLVSQVENASGYEIYYTYDEAGRLIKTSDKEGTLKELSYDIYGRVESEKDAKGDTKSYKYDLVDNLTDIIYSSDERYNITLGYDEYGNPVTLEDISGTQDITVDERGDITSVKTPDGNKLEYIRDIYGNVVTLIYPDGSKVNYEYDSNNRLTKVINKDGNETSYSYDALGNVIEVIRDNGTRTNTTYNAINQVETISNYDSDGQIISAYMYNYNKSGYVDRETSLNEGVEKVTEVTYDLNGQIKKTNTVTRENGNRNEVIVTYGYDCTGNKRTIDIEENGVHTKKELSYDESGKLISSSENGFVTTYSYDSNGNIIEEKSDDSVIKYSYDVENRLTTVEKNDTLLMAALYNGMGNRIFTLERKDTLEKETNYKREYENTGKNTIDCDTNNEDESEDNKSIEDTSSDGDDNEVSETDKETTYKKNSVFWYGFIHGILDILSLYPYKNEKQLSESYRFESAMDNTSIESGDDKGDNTSEEAKTPDEVKETNITKEELSDEAGNGSYDKDLYRLVVIPYEEDVASHDYISTSYVYDINQSYDNVVSEYDIDGHKTNSYTYGNERISSEDYYYLYDRLGSVVNLTNYESQNMLSYSYDIYGETTAYDNSTTYEGKDALGALGNKYGYTGEVRDYNTGLIYLRARYLNPETGSFMSRDTYSGTITNPLTQNLYTYAGNNPLNTTDPSGHSWLLDKVSDIATKVGNTVGKVVGQVKSSPSSFIGTDNIALTKVKKIAKAKTTEVLDKIGRKADKYITQDKIDEQLEIIDGKDKNIIARYDAFNKILATNWISQYGHKSNKCNFLSPALERQLRIALNSYTDFKNGYNAENQLVTIDAPTSSFVSSLTLYGEMLNYAKNNKTLKGFKSNGVSLDVMQSPWEELNEKKAMADDPEMFNCGRIFAGAVMVVTVIISVWGFVASLVKPVGAASLLAANSGDDVANLTMNVANSSDDIARTYETVSSNIDDVGTGLSTVTDKTEAISSVTKGNEIENVVVNEADDVVRGATGEGNVVKTNYVQSSGKINNFPQNEGYGSFNKLKQRIGSAGEGKDWHHIVEQSQITKSGFLPEQIHNTSNIIAVDHATHMKITGYYNTKSFNYTNGLSVREWLTGQSYETQYTFGIEVLKNFGVTIQ